MLDTSSPKPRKDTPLNIPMNMPAHTPIHAPGINTVNPPPRKMDQIMATIRYMVPVNASINPNTICAFKTGKS
jgi:hypothetical protein